MKKILILTLLLKFLIFCCYVFSNGEWHNKTEKEEEMQRILNPERQQIPQQKLFSQPEEKKILEKENRENKNFYFCDINHFSFFKKVV